MILTTLAQIIIYLGGGPIKWSHTQTPQLFIVDLYTDYPRLTGLVCECHSLFSTLITDRSVSCWVPQNMRFQHRSTSSHASNLMTLTRSSNNPNLWFSNLVQFMFKSTLTFMIFFMITLFFCYLTEGLVQGICCEIPFARNDYGFLCNDFIMTTRYQLNGFKFSKYSRSLSLASL